MHVIWTIFPLSNGERQLWGERVSTLNSETPFLSQTRSQHKRTLVAPADLPGTKQPADSGGTTEKPRSYGEGPLHLHHCPPGWARRRAFNGALGSLITAKKWSRAFLYDPPRGNATGLKSHQKSRSWKIKLQTVTKARIEMLTMTRLAGLTRKSEEEGDVRSGDTEGVHQGKGTPPSLLRKALSLGLPRKEVQKPACRYSRRPGRSAPRLPGLT